MPVAWFICPYKIKIVGGRQLRYCAMSDFHSQIVADGGAWAESEVLGNVAIVKVRALEATLEIINAATGFVRLPKDHLSMQLSDLTPTQKTEIVSKLQAMGYPLAEIRDRLGDDIGTHTLGDVLRFAATRRRKPRWDSTLGEIVIDGPDQPTRSIDELDDTVTE